MSFHPRNHTHAHTHTCAVNRQAQSYLMQSHGDEEQYEHSSYDCQHNDPSSNSAFWDLSVEYCVHSDPIWPA